MIIEGRTAFDMINKHDKKSLSTLCEEIDQLLGDGIPIAQLTEFCGVPGIGKTQMGYLIIFIIMFFNLFKKNEQK